MTQTFTYTVADCFQNRQETVTGATEAEAIRLVYEMLVEWNDGDRHCGAAIAAGVIRPLTHGRPADLVYLDTDPRGFWLACATHIEGDNQAFAAGTDSPFTADGDA